MQELQAKFARLREIKKEQKNLREMYRDALAQADKYQEIVEEIKTLREKKKEIEERIKAQMGRAYEKLEDLRAETQTENELLTDLAISTLMKGETVEVKDEFDNVHEPVWGVKFKKTNLGNTAE